MSAPFKLLPTITIINQQAVTSSLEVARFFSKRHDHVLRDIQILVKAIENTQFNASNFGLSSKTQKIPNGGTKETTAYNLTRDGFTLLAMGYTGKRALAFKIAYIEAFNAMEATLSHAPPTEPAPQGLQDTSQLNIDKAQATIKEHASEINGRIATQHVNLSSWLLESAEKAATHAKIAMLDCAEFMNQKSIAYIAKSRDAAYATDLRLQQLIADEEERQRNTHGKHPVIPFNGVIINEAGREYSTNQAMQGGASC